ncbi:MAG: class I SAM-dependent methyltransferase [Alphaproteobacteria bacterium]
MQINAETLKHFYRSAQGQVVRAVLQSHITALRDNPKGRRILGCGYALPYLDDFERAERSIAAIPQEIGTQYWPKDGKNKTCLYDHALPFETNSIDCVLLIHGLEHSKNPQGDLVEIYRVLKSTGRLIIVTPNRSGLWACFDSSPLGQGRPYSLAQLHKLLDDTKFIRAQSRKALFTPPLRGHWIEKISSLAEGAGRFLPLPAGVHIVEASKQIYARPPPPRGAKAPAVSKPLIPKTAMPFEGE